MKDLLRQVIYRYRYPGIATSPGATIGGEVHYGSHIVLCDHARIYGVSIGSHAYVGSHSHVQYATLGSFVAIGPEVRVGLGIHPMDLVSTYPSFYASRASAVVPMARSTRVKEYARVSIGSDVWIGSRAMIMDGVDIGHGAVIAAGAVVTKAVAPYAIVGGVPARLIRFRFPEAIVADLLSIAWWTWPDKLIRERAEDFADVEQFIEKYRSKSTAS